MNVLPVLFDKTQKKFYAVIAAYSALFILIYLSLYFLGLFKHLPSAENILFWDATWYNTIKEKGYSYYWYMASNSAFFPLFPYMWKILHVGNLGISIVNCLLFWFSLNLLYRTFNIKTKHLLLFISLPSMIFFYLPYTESLFFFFCTLFFIGLKKDNLQLIFFGLLFASLTRATAMFFVPSIIAMEILSHNAYFTKRKMRNILVMSVASLLGLLIVVLIQYYQTHEWFAFAKQQMRFWRHKFNFPGFPLVAHGGDNSLWIDGIAFLVGCSVFFTVIAMSIKRFFSKSLTVFYENRAFLFSIFYLTIVTFYGLFFNAKCYNAQTTIDSMNRYFFCTIFAFIFISFVFDYFPLTKLSYLVFALGTIYGLYLIGLNGDHLTFLPAGQYTVDASLYFLVGLFIYCNFIYFAASNYKYSNYITLLAFGFNIILGTYCLHTFIQGQYVG